MKSGRLYSVVTEHWPRIAAGLVVVIGLVEFVIGGLTADSRIEYYLMAWAGATGGLWFLSEKAERALSDESRTQMSRWAREADRRSAIATVPAQFEVLFDRIFGQRHVTPRCFALSALASFCAVGLVTALWVLVSWPREWLVAPVAGEPFVLSVIPRAAVDRIVPLLFVATVVNLIPDYLSLLQSRYLIRRMAAGARKGRVLLLDAVLTACFGFAAVFATVVYLPGGLRDSGDRIIRTQANLSPDNSVSVQRGAYRRAALDVVRLHQLIRLQLSNGSASFDGPHGLRYSVLGIDREAGLRLLGEPQQVGSVVALGPDGTSLETEFWSPLDSAAVTESVQGTSASVPMGVFFYSAFFTSVWLWLYAASVLLARVLIRMNSGVGFLLRVTDVENQPFRSMGFVSVLIVSALFALGLPLVLI